MRIGNGAVASVIALTCFGLPALDAEAQVVEVFTEFCVPALDFIDEHQQNQALIKNFHTLNAEYGRLKGQYTGRCTSCSITYNMGLNQYDDACMHAGMANDHLADIGWNKYLTALPLLGCLGTADNSIEAAQDQLREAIEALQMAISSMREAISELPPPATCPLFIGPQRPPPTPTADQYDEGSEYDEGGEYDEYDEYDDYDEEGEYDDAL